MKLKAIACTLGAAAAALPISALAHIGGHGDHGDHHHSHGVLETAAHAFAHPFTGADHMAAMLAVGAWSALALGGTRSRTAWRAPAAFLALLVAGCLAGFAGLYVPAIEPMIAASVLVLGLLVAVQQKMPWGAAAGLAGVFAFFHGAAHGYELFGEGWATSTATLVGMAAGSAVLHLGGMALGHTAMQRHVVLAKVAGGITAALGVFMLTRLA